MKRLRKTQSNPKAARKKMSRTRAGRKAHATKVNFQIDVGNFAAALAEKNWKYSARETAAIQVERTEKITGKVQLIPFDEAYANLSPWLGLSFSNISELGFSDMLVDALLSGARIFTPKAEYRIFFKERF